MNDRVRVYELAKQMNVSNQVLIHELRELGYDIKSHSSTIDNHVVGLLIAALSKKKSGTTKTSTKAAPATPKGTTTVNKTAPPPPPVVKPRVLSRRKPIIQPSEVDQETSTALANVAQKPPEVPALPADMPPVKTEPEVTTTAPQLEDKSSLPGLRHLGEQIQIEPELPGKSALPVPAQPPTQETPSTEEQRSVDALTDATHLDASKSVVPSVPVRVASPSIRATPPRPPRLHRQHAAERDRHISKKEEKTKLAAIAVEAPRVITLTGSLTVQELAERMSVSESEIIKRLFIKGFMRTVNQVVELELARELAVEMEYEVLSEADVKEPEQLPKIFTEEELKFLVPRPPVVTIMGHVDHGKTSLLDAIRQTKFQLTAAEAGGITQHIGAYHVEVPGEDGVMRQVVFLDTPGHEAFTAMRARGAKATDIAILVVAADDGVMPQTVEAIDHAKAAHVPIIVAINKMDKPEADADRVLGQLTEHGLLSDRYGGDTVTVNVSAKKRTGLDELLEMILLVSDMQNLKANPEQPASGTIIEAELSRGRGAVATALVQNGMLHEGDIIVAGSKSGRVRALFDDRGQRVKAAGPSMPVEVLGLDEVPQAGDSFEVVEDMQVGRALVEQRKLTDTSHFQQHVTLESLHDLLEQGSVKELNVIIKADVQGTAEAIADQVSKLSGLQVQVNVVRVASGSITENDVNLAASSNAIVIGFNVEPDQNAGRVREAIGVDVRTYNIIYQITDDLEKAIQGLIQPVKKEVPIGTAEVRQVFKFNKSLTIAGCYVTAGKLLRGAMVKLERAGEIIHQGKIETLKRFKDDAKEVAQGFECGVSIEKFNDLQEGDLINAFVIQEEKREIIR